MKRYRKDSAESGFSVSRNRLRELAERNRQRRVRAASLSETNTCYPIKEEVKQPVPDLLQAKKDEHEAEDDNGDDVTDGEEEDEIKNTLSIVRFAREVNSRRISIDYHK